MSTDNKAIRVVARNLLEIVIPPELFERLKRSLESKEVREGEVASSKDRRFIIRLVSNQDDGCHVLIQACMRDQTLLQEKLKEIAFQLDVEFHDLPSTST